MPARMTWPVFCGHVPRKAGGRFRWPGPPPGLPAPKVRAGQTWNMRAGTPRATGQDLVAPVDKQLAARRRRVLLVLGGIATAFVLWEIVTSLVAYTDDAYV